MKFYSYLGGSRWKTNMLSKRLQIPPPNIMTKINVKPILSRTGASRRSTVEERAREMVVCTPMYNGIFSGGLTSPSSNDTVII